MRSLVTDAGRLMMVAGAALAVAGCSSSNEEATEAADVNALDANLMLEQAGNDASAMESVANVSEPTVTTNAGEGGNATDVLGETSGGDTGGNTVDANRSGT